MSWRQLTFGRTIDAPTFPAHLHLEYVGPLFIVFGKRAATRLIGQVIILEAKLSEVLFCTFDHRRCYASLAAGDFLLDVIFKKMLAVERI